MSSTTKIGKSEKAEQLQQLFQRLDDLVSDQNYKKALKVADEILKISKHDSDAVSAKAVILVQLDRSVEALKLLETAGTEVQEALQFVKAYAFYRAGDFQNALKLIMSGYVTGLPGLQLEALLRYHMGEFEKAADLYDKIVKEQHKDVWEVQTNQIASYILAGRSSQASSLQKGTSSFYEVLYNTACSWIELGNYSQADTLLQKALRVGQETLLGDDWSQEETNLELATIRAQLAYVQYKLGQEDEAKETMQELLKLKGLDDDVVRYICINNLWVAGGNQADKKEGHRDGKALMKRLTSVFESGSKFTSFTAQLTKRLSIPQKLVLCCNVVILLMLANRKEDCKTLLSHISTEYSRTEKYDILQACLLSQDRKYQDALQVLQGVLEPSTQLSLLGVQIAIMNRQPQQACDTLIASQFVSEPAGIVSIVSMKEQQKDFVGAEEFLNKAMSQGQLQGEAVQWCTQKLAELKLKQDKLEEGMQLFKQIQSYNGNEQIQLDPIVKSKLAFATALIDPGQVDNFVEQTELEAFEEQIDVDIDYLENNLGNVGIGSGRKRAQEGEEGGKKKRRKRKPRYPKGFDPENPGPMPDPERWLPKWQRSDYKKKSKRRKDKQAVVKGTQGGIVDDSLDAATHSVSEASTSSKAKKPKLPPRPKGVKGRRK